MHSAMMTLVSILSLILSFPHFATPFLPLFVPCFSQETGSATRVTARPHGHIDFCLLDGTDMKSLTVSLDPHWLTARFPTVSRVGLLIQFTHGLPYGAMYDWVGLPLCSYIPVLLNLTYTLHHFPSYPAPIGGRNWNPIIQSPTRGRTISRGRFRTADTLRRILDTSPSPRPALSTPPRLTATSPRHTNNPPSIKIPDSRSNTNSGNQTISARLTMGGTFAATEPLVLVIPDDYSFENNAKTTALRSPSPILSSRSYTSAHSPSTVSSVSDLHSSDIDGGRRRLADGRGTKKRSGLRPVPRFMPRTPGGRTAQLEVSGATARAPMMHAHFVEPEIPLVVRNEEGEERPVDEAIIGDLSPLPPAEEPLHHSESPYGSNEAHSSPAIPSPSKPSTPSLDENQQERQRAQSLSASVSSIINQARALEHMKLAGTGKIKGGSNLKGSPVWTAQHKLRGSVDSTAGNAGTTDSTSNFGNGATGSGPSSKRTSWVGTGLMGLGLAITPSSSTNVSTGASTPPMRVSFAKEPVRYSEERESGAFDEDEEEEEEGSEAGIDVRGMDAEADGSLTVKPRTIRRTRSWNGSVRGVGSRRVPSKQRSKGGEKGKDKKQGWLEWFLAAGTAAGAGGVPGHMSATGSSMGIGREELFENRGRDDW
jgi:hypothetical protein